MSTCTRITSSAVIEGLIEGLKASFVTLANKDFNLWPFPLLPLFLLCIWRWRIGFQPTVYFKYRCIISLLTYSLTCFVAKYIADFFWKCTVFGERTCKFQQVTTLTCNNFNMFIKISITMVLYNMLCLAVQCFRPTVYFKLIWSHACQIVIASVKGIANWSVLS